MKYVILIIILISLIGCNKETNNIKTNTNTSYEENNKTNETNNQTSDNNTNNEINNIKYSNNDILVINELENLNNNVDELLNSKDITNIKDKAKSIFITTVDFIFFDGEIKGVKFDDLTSKAKEKVLSIISTIDSKIESKFPNYKESISKTTKNAYNKASSLIKEGASNISTFSKEKLGEENYNSIIEAKDEIIKYTKNALDIIGDFTINVFDKSKDYLNNWYNNFKK